MKKAYFYIDDVIWCLRDVTQKRPASLFDDPFFSMLKNAHDEYGMTVQLNLFYRTDFFYGSREFTLKDVTDAYRSEFDEASDWLKFGFHAKQEYPAFPYVNAEYEDVKMDCDAIFGEVRRFAGDKSISYVVVPHVLPISKEGVRALCDCGVKLVNASAGDAFEFEEEPDVLPVWYKMRLLHNRKPETKLYRKKTRMIEHQTTICAYNHLDLETYATVRHKLAGIRDKEFDIYYKGLCNGPCLNLYGLSELEDEYAPLIGKDYIGSGLHEQYFYPDYFAYQPEYADKIYKMCEILKRNGYEFITGDDMIEAIAE
ncbi:MAG: hypothetical protein IJB42_03275 [Oscillospiraceae bacterium]|nr:hypothetical protein [Oscillospiraceae bacterium]